MNRFLRDVLGCACGFALAFPALAEEVELIPEEQAPWHLTQLWAWLRPHYNYGPRVLEITSSPPGAALDLFYVRANFQKRYEQARAPASVRLPPRAHAGPRDAVNIRAFLDGYQSQERSVRVRSGVASLKIDLVPLPNSLRSLAHSYFLGRGALSFLTEEAPEVRLQRTEEGFNVILHHTALAASHMAPRIQYSSPLIKKLHSQQVGEDLILRVEWTASARSAALDLRQHRSHDPARNLYAFVVDLIPENWEADAVARARATLAKLRASNVSGCAFLFEESLREVLDPEALARALAPRGSFTDSYLRAAMQRLAELNPEGRLTLQSGRSYRGDSPLELAAALAEAAQVRGYLSLLRGWVWELEPDAEQKRYETLRSLVAPELPPDEFRVFLQRAEDNELSCRSLRSRGEEHALAEISFSNLGGCRTSARAPAPFGCGGADGR